MSDSHGSIRARVGTPLAALGLVIYLLREFLGMFTDAKEFGELFPGAINWVAAPWFGPLVFAIGVVLYLWAHHDWKRGRNVFDSLYADYGVRHPMASLVTVCLIGALVGAITFGKTWKYVASRHAATTEKPEVSNQVPHPEADAKASSPTSSPHAQDKHAKTEKKSALPPPVIDLQAGRHIKFDDSKIVAHEGPAVRTGKGINDLSFNKTLIEGGVKTGTESKDALAAPVEAITPEIQYQESSPEEIVALRKRATTLINELFMCYTDWRKCEREWLDKKNEDKADEVSKNFTDEYDKNYRQKVIKTRDSLLKSVKQRPKRAPDVETSYKPHGEYIFPDVVQSQLCDLIVLVNQMEKENGLEISCVDVKQKIPFCN